MIIGCDTGFFKQLLEYNPTTLAVWQKARSYEISLVTSCITLFELQRLAFRGVIPLDRANVLIEIIPDTCKVVWLAEDNMQLLEKAARTAHGNGMSMADALILTSLIYANAQAVYTTDNDMSLYKSGPKIIRL